MNNHEKKCSECSKKPEQKSIDSTKHRRFNCVCLIITALLFLDVVAINLLQSNRPTFSESEKRDLAAFPEFSIVSLTDGSFFSGLSDFFSDTFIGRERFVSLSKSMERLTGFDGDLVLLQKGTPEQMEDPDLDALLEKLTEKQTQETEPPTETEVKTETEAYPETAISTETETDVPGIQYINLSLSQTEVSLAIGSSIQLDAVLETEGDGTPEPISWVIDNRDIVEITVNQAGISILAKAVGTATVSCCCGNLEKSCTVNITELSTKQNDLKDYEFLSNDIFVYGDAAFLTAGYGPQGAASYLQMAQYYQSLFPDTRISVMPIPVSSVIIDDERITKKIPNQGNSLFKMEDLYSGSGINFVNVYSTFFAHRNEYLYLKTDHHWNGCGAYYAYFALMDSMGESPIPLSEMRNQTIRKDYHGSLYSYTKDSRLLEFSDTIEAYYPIKSCTMTVTRTDGSVNVYQSPIVPEYGNYLSFIAGDNPYTVINVPDNPQDKSILVLKDSYGNALVPYLVNHYGNIIVVDPRYSAINIYTQFKDYGLDDILFLNNMQCVNTSPWIRMFLELVGIRSE